MLRMRLAHGLLQRGRVFSIQGVRLCAVADHHVRVDRQQVGEDLLRIFLGTDVEAMGLPVVCAKDYTVAVEYGDKVDTVAGMFGI